MYRLRGKRCVKLIFQRCGDNISQSSFYAYIKRYPDLPLRLPTSEEKLIAWWKAFNEKEGVRGQGLGVRTLNRWPASHPNLVINPAMKLP